MGWKSGGEYRASNGNGDSGKEEKSSNSYRCPICNRFHQKGQKCSREVNISKYLEIHDSDLAALFVNSPKKPNKDESDS